MQRIAITHQRVRVGFPRIPDADLHDLEFASEGAASVRMRKQLVRGLGPTVKIVGQRHLIFENHLLFVVVDQRVFVPVSSMI